MYGIGLFKGLGITVRHFVDSFTQDLKWMGTRWTTQTFAVRQGSDAKGVFTVEYPNEKIAVPERFRFVPFLVVNNYDDPYAPGEDWCTSCGICAKVCPPQCIWIVRGSDPGYRAARASARSVLHRHRHLHELRLLRGILPIRRHQNGS